MNSRQRICGRDSKGIGCVDTNAVVGIAAGHGEGGCPKDRDGCGSTGTTTAVLVGVGHGDVLLSAGRPLCLDSVRVLSADDGAAVHVPYIVGHIGCGGEGDGIVGFRSI